MLRTPCLLLLVLVAAAPSQNLLINPGFESGLTGWSTFGNVFHQTSSAPQFVPHAGNGLISTFGNFSGSFNVSGAFQSFTAGPGDVFEMGAFARHFSGDALTGGGAPNANWVVAKIAFFNGGGTEIGSAETTILNGAFSTNTWHGPTLFQGTAPAGTTNVQALLLYLQPGFAGGACHLDDVTFALVNPTQPTNTVPAVGLRSRIAQSGVFEVQEVRSDGTLGPWSEFEIRGINVGWTPSGYYPWTTPLPMLADPAFHDVLDELKAAGVNVLRFYYLPGGSTGPLASQFRATLDLCYRMGIKVLWALDASLIGNSQALTDLAISVQAYGNHPATLGFAIGNEWNLNLGQAAAVAQAGNVQTIASYLKSIDPNRAVISSLACGPHNDIFESAGPSTATSIVNAASDVDLWGMNLYRAGTFHPFFHLWPSHTGNAPYAIFEWGADSWNQNSFSVDFPTQASETASHLDETWRVTAGPSRQLGYAGTVVFAAVDEYWKNSLPGNSVFVQESAGFFTTASFAPSSAPGLSLNFRADHDGHRSEEHFGILQLPGLARKPVFNIVADRFNYRTTPRPDLNITVLSSGWLGTAGALDNGYWGLRINGNDVWSEEGGAVARGLTIVTIDTSTGSVSSKLTFDTYDAVALGTPAITNAIAAINALPTGTLVALAAADTLVYFNNNPAPYAGLVAAIQARTGSTQIGSVSFREGWALLGYIGASAPLAEGTPTLNSRVIASANVTLDLDGDGLSDALDLDLDDDGVSNALETARGTDPVRPAGQLLVHDMTMNPSSRVLSISVLPGDAAGTLGDIDFASLRFEVATPFTLDATPFLFTLFNITFDPSGGVTLTSLVPMPAIQNGRLTFRFLDVSGRLATSSVRID